MVSARVRALPCGGNPSRRPRREATNANLLVRLADLDGRHRATGAKVVQYSKSEAALEKACRSLQGEINELKHTGAREFAIQRLPAEETIARLQSASGTLEAQLTEAWAELSACKSKSDEAGATLQRELAAARQAVSDAFARHDVGKSGNHDVFVGKNRGLDMESNLLQDSCGRLGNFDHICSTRARSGPNPASPGRIWSTCGRIWSRAGEVWQSIGRFGKLWQRSAKHGPKLAHMGQICVEFPRPARGPCTDVSPGGNVQDLLQSGGAETTRARCFGMVSLFTMTF